MFCPNCGNQIEDGSLFCPFCGGSTGNQPTGNEVTQLYEEEPVTQLNPEFNMMQASKKTAKPSRKKIYIISALATGVLVAAGVLTAVLLLGKNNKPKVPKTTETTVATATEAETTEEVVSEAEKEEMELKLEEKLKEVCEENGYCKTGELGADFFDVSADIGFDTTYRCQYSEKGVLSYRIGEYLPGTNVLIVFLNEDDGVHVRLYVPNNDTVEMIDDQLLQATGCTHYYVEDFTGNIEDAPATGKNLVISDILIGGVYFYNYDHNYTVDIIEINSEYYIRTCYYKGVNYNTTMNENYVTLTKINADGFQLYKSLSIENDCLGTSPLIYTMKIKVYDYVEDSEFKFEADEWERYKTENSIEEDWDDPNTESLIQSYNKDNLTKSIEQINKFYDEAGLPEMKYSGSYDTDDWDSDWNEWFKYDVTVYSKPLFSIRAVIDKDILYSVMRGEKSIYEYLRFAITDNSADVNEYSDSIRKWWRSAEEETTEATTEETTTETTTEATEAKSEELTVKYGDTIRTTCEEKVEGAASDGRPEVAEWHNPTEKTLVVANSTEEFKYADYELPEETVTANVNKAVGKKVGDEFVLTFEFGDGSYSYKYTILEIIPAQ
ncbi:MAG: zinc-ribbon domain-containing protein [Eubacterium sp.]|nr:zinc-ribbon domain-containing protein [Eubacterium sp.]